MFDFIVQNLATIIVFTILLVIVAAIIINMIRNKKLGKSSCSCGCKACPMSDTCHSKK
ncbi:MAG: FeoB-associated Cys-rich membrane protein [Clostridia bacterium]|nr:FeoB-associated Cys-rich membrane protein [Clostridia bacterium]